MKYRTKTGRLLTEADIESFASEAEEGYDVEELLQRQWDLRARLVTGSADQMKE